MPKDEMSVLNGPIEKGLHKINKLAIAAGFGPLKAGEIVKMLEKVEVPKPINGIKQPDEIMNPNGMTSDDAGIRDLMLRSKTPIRGALSMVTNPMDANGSGFAAMNLPFDPIKNSQYGNVPLIPGQKKPVSEWF